MADINFANIGPARVTAAQTSRARNVVLANAGTPAARRELLEMLGILDDRLAHYDNTGRGPEDGGAAASPTSPATPPTPAPATRPDPHPAPITTDRASRGRGHRALTQRRPTDTEDWRDQARCREIDAETFFPLGNTGPAAAQLAAAKRACGSCAVRAACLAWALAHPAETQFGVWGGLDEDERRALVRHRARPAAAGRD